MLPLDKKFSPFLFIVALLSATLLILSLRNFGIGLSNDSIAYWAAAESFYETGSFFLSYRDTYFTDWPPLFSIFLSSAYFLAIENKLAFYSLQIVLVYFAVVYTLGVLALELTNSNTLAIIAMLFFVLSPTTYITFSYLWSETYFILFTMAFLVSLERYLHTNKLSFLFFCALMACLSVLMRYAGVVNIFTGFLFLLLYPYSRINYRIKRVSLFVCISCMPLALWFIRNYFISATLTGAGRTVEVSNVKYAVLMLSKAFWEWLLPYPHISFGGIITTVLFVLFFIVLSYFILKIVKGKLLVPILFLNSVFYFLLIFFSSLLQSSGFADFRLTSPAYFSFILILIYILHVLISKRNMLLNSFLFIYIGFIIAYNSYGYFSYLMESKISGIKGYSDRNFRNTTIVKYLQQAEWLERYTSCKCAFTNSPHLLYYYNVRGVLQITEALGSRGHISEQFEEVTEEKVIIWFGDIELLKKLMGHDFNKYYITKTIEFPDGVILWLSLNEAAPLQEAERPL